ncbi:14129_t:CDS:2, partial [Racocetra fulgida]
TSAIKTQIKLFKLYFTELSTLQNKLKKYFICEIHYNQIFAKDNYLNYLKDESLPYPRKQSRNSNTLNLNSVEMDSDLLTQIENLKNSLNILITEHSKQLQVIEVKNSLISELEHKCEYFKKQVNDLSLRLESLDKYKSQVEILTNEKNKLKNENKTDLLTENNINQLFYLSDDMKNIIEIKLHDFINEIISNLYSEKNQEANKIDKLVEK